MPALLSSVVCAVAAAPEVDPAVAAWQTEFDRVKATPGSFDAWTALLSSTEKLVSLVCTLQLSLMLCALCGMFTLRCKLVGPPCCD